MLALHHTRKKLRVAGATLDRAAKFYAFECTHTAYSYASKSLEAFTKIDTIEYEFSLYKVQMVTSLAIPN